MLKHLILGNWKSYGSKSQLQHYLDAVEIAPPSMPQGFGWGLALPFHLIEQAGARKSLMVGAENVSAHEEGPFTGEIHAGMLADLGCHFCLVGHSERRQLFHEQEDTLQDKLQALVKTGILPVYCIGESLDERHSGNLEAVLRKQLVPLNTLQSGLHLAVAYEPVWAIGTGVAATRDDVNQAHDLIRELMRDFPNPAAPILYGGSVKPGNAADLASVHGVNGFLVGGASLKPDTFLPIITAYLEGKGVSAK